MANEIVGRIRQFPKQGQRQDEIKAALMQAQELDADWRAGKLQSYVYAVGDDVVQVAMDAYASCYSTNPLITKAFPSLARMEDDILAMTADLLHAPEPIGVVTTGGTESNLLAVLSAREWSRQHRPEVETPEIVVPWSAHPSFNKAAHLFGMRVVRTPVTVDFTADPAAMIAAAGENTVLIAVSAPSDTHGIVEPISELSDFALEHGILLHVDACVGGFFLPFLERIGEPVTPWDFRVSGVTSISADLHKHGYAPKGSSVVLYRDRALREFNVFAFEEWPTGIFSSATLVGTRSGGTVAAAWAVMNYLGEDGYCRIVSKTMQITRKYREGIIAIPGLKIYGVPVMNKFGYGSDEFDIFAVAEGMIQRGWSVNLQETPPGINMHLYPIHEEVAERYLFDLEEVVSLVAEGRIARTSALTAKYN